MSSIAKRSIDAKTAQMAIDAAAAKARELGLHMCIAMTDESGDLKAFYRMDGAPKKRAVSQMQRTLRGWRPGVLELWSNWASDRVGAHEC